MDHGHGRGHTYFRPPFKIFTWFGYQRFEYNTLTCFIIQKIISLDHDYSKAIPYITLNRPNYEYSLGMYFSHFLYNFFFTFLREGEKKKYIGIYGIFIQFILFYIIYSFYFILLQWYNELSEQSLDLPNFRK